MMRIWKGLFLALLFVVVVESSEKLHPSFDPSDYFAGAQSRPRLQIVTPQDGAVLESGALEIEIELHGYEIPSNFHTSTVCVGLSSSSSSSSSTSSSSGRDGIVGGLYSEQCFADNKDKTFHVGGLTAGAQYALRIVLYERGNAIAVSVRNFRVAGIAVQKGVFAFAESTHDNNEEEGGRGEQQEELITIQTAVQVAMQMQSNGMEQQAEKIYRSVLAEAPAHPDALHLLGVIHYQKGEHATAIAYIEKALQSNNNYEGFHNSLGECYRILGRVDEAHTQFTLALALNPKYASAGFNLGLVLQMQSKWPEAIKQYRMVVQMQSQAKEEKEGQGQAALVLESKTRECDLTYALGLLEQAISCWEDGLALFPDSDLMHNELGNLYSQIGEYDVSLQLYRKAASLGSFVAELNTAHILELQGFYLEARASFAASLENAVNANLPVFHIKLRLATVLPRILPQSESELKEVRTTLERELDALLSASPDVVTVDNAPPLSFGFMQLFHLAFHGQGNAAIKQKLANVYYRLCPALRTAYFMEMSNSQVQEGGHDSAIGRGERGGGDESKEKKEIQVEEEEEEKEIDEDEEEAKEGRAEGSENGSRPLRVGFVSRYFRSNHIVGEIVHGLMPLLRQSDDLQIWVFCIDDVDFHLLPNSSVSSNDSSLPASAAGAKGDDPVLALIKKEAYALVPLPLDNLGYAAQVLRSHALDVIVYPEIGHDPVSYFLAFARLAPVQAAWGLAHPDTTGISNVDYFLSSSSIEEPEAEREYSEKLVRFNSLGTRFTNTSFVGKAFSSHQLINGDGTKNVTDRLGLPRAAHLYAVVSSLSKLHGKFDEALSRILLGDRLGYLIIIEQQHAKLLHWQRLFTFRLAGKYSDDVKQRIIFYSPTNAQDGLDILRACHLLLDPFPVSGLLGPLQALALGVPVVTWPSNRLGGRLALGLYKQLGYGGHGGGGGEEEEDTLVVNSLNAYVKTSLSIAHKPKLRAKHTANIIALHYKLFASVEQSIGVGKEWSKWLHSAVESSGGRNRNRVFVPAPLPRQQLTNFKDEL